VGGQPEHRPRTEQLPSITWRQIVLPDMGAAAEEHRHVDPVIDNKQSPAIRAQSRDRLRFREDLTRVPVFPAKLHDSHP
jgi:hypothetical protein